MRVYGTGHEIADTVARSLARGFGECNAAIGYGILRGMAENLRAHEHWFLVDRGYFSPAHYDGYYRISYKGTQAKYDPAFPITWKYMGAPLEPVRKYDKSKPVLVCPPTLAVDTFFELGAWIDWLPENRIMRDKNDKNPIPWNDISAVITFNSSVGWEALRRGIPCLSDPLHSVVGSYYNTNSLDEVIEKFNTAPREPLFDFMSSHQFRLAEIEQGEACQLIEHYTGRTPNEPRRLDRV